MLISNIAYLELEMFLLANVKIKAIRSSLTKLNPTGGGNATSMPKAGIPCKEGGERGKVGVPSFENGAQTHQKVSSQKLETHLQSSPKGNALAHRDTAITGPACATFRRRSKEPRGEKKRQDAGHRERPE